MCNSISHSVLTEYKSEIDQRIISHKVRNENPTNNPNVPPNSATNELNGYRYASSLTVTVLVLNPNMYPGNPDGSGTGSISLLLKYCINLHGFKHPVRLKTELLKRR